MKPAIQPKRITQISEQIFNPVKTPIIIDNQMYLMVQQDIRKIQETRHISYNKFSENDFQMQNVSFCEPATNFIRAPVESSNLPICNINPELRTCPENTNMDWEIDEPNVLQEVATSTSDIDLIDRNFSKSERCVKLSVAIPGCCKCCLVKESTREGSRDKFVLKDDEEEMTALEKLKLKKLCEG